PSRQEEQQPPAQITGTTPRGSLHGLRFHRLGRPHDSHTVPQAGHLRAVARAPRNRRLGRPPRPNRPNPPLRDPQIRRVRLRDLQRLRLRPGNLDPTSPRPPYKNIPANNCPSLYLIPSLSLSSSRFPTTLIRSK
ncbi:unnamed protein product, partial [Linum tenue]